MSDQHVGEHGLVLEQFRILERTGDAEGGDPMRGHVGDVRALEGHGARLGVVETADEVEHRGLAGTVGADDAEHLAGADAEGHVANGLDPTEADRQAAGLEQHVLRHGIARGLAHRRHRTRFHRTRSVRR